MNHPRSPAWIRLSPLVFVYEAGSESPKLPAGGLALAQIPSCAFGDGTHPTTRLCAGAVDLLCRQLGPGAILDVGTGTGVLARIARARGARFIAATDIDPEAIQAARANSELDSHPVEIEVEDAPPDRWGPRFDLVVANILEGPLRMLAPALARAVAPGGSLLLSGFTPMQTAALRVAFAGLGLSEPAQSTLEGWALLHFRRRA